MMEPSEHPHQQTTPLVLIAGDDPAARQVSRTALQASGFIVEEAENGSDALARFESLRPDVVLLDVEMPKLDGPSTCVEIRKLPEGQRTPVLMITGEDHVESLSRAYQAGATDFIVKPINGVILQQRLRYALRTSRAMDTLEQGQAETMALLDAIPDLMFQVDGSGVVLDYRPSQDPEPRGIAQQIVNKDLSQVLPKSVSLDCMNSVRKTLDTGQTQTFEYKMSQQGTLREYEARIVPKGGGRVLAIVRDITERNQTVHALEKERDFAASVLDTEAALVMVLDRRGCIVRFNRACEQATGYQSEEVSYKVPWSLFPPSHEMEWDRENFQTVLTGRKVSDYEGHLLTKEGDQRLIAWSHSAVLDHEGRVEYVIRTGGDITERKKAEERIRLQADYDELTGLPSRALFMENLSRAISASSRHHRLMAVLFLGLDRVKDGNGRLGHEQGDLLLKAVGERLRNYIRKSDYVAHQTPEGELGALSRFGDEEFTIFLTDLRDPDGAAKAAERLLEVIAAPYDLNGSEVGVSASVGISVYPHDSTTEDSMLVNAELAMQAARRSQSNAYHFYSNSMNASSPKCLAFEEEFRRALEKEEFFLVHQPKFFAATGDTVGLESLIRWNHPSRGTVPPSEFLSSAEETGLVIPMGKWIMRTACRQAAEWQKTSPSPVRLAVNLSSVQFWRDDLPQDIAEALEESGLDPSCLELEIAESTLMENGGEVAGVLQRLKQLGVQIAIDDFGTGFSSLNYLKDCPVDTLKIDRSFIANLPEDALDAAITAATIAVARTLGLKVVAEGVETQEQFEFLKNEGCEQVQGYLFSPPVQANEVEQFLLPEPAAVSA